MRKSLHGLRRPATALGWTLATTSYLAMLARAASGSLGFPGILLETTTLYLLVPAWVALVFAAITRSRWLAIAAVPTVVAHVVWCAPASFPAPRAERTPPTSDAAVEEPRLRVATANLLYVNPASDALADELRTIDADVLALQELTPGWVSVLARRGVLARYPHHALAPEDGCFGIGVLSKWPIVARRVIDLGGVPALRVHIHDPTRDFDLVAVHTLPPRTPEYAAQWRAQLRRLGAIAAERNRPLVVAGDLNASPFTRAYAQLLTRARLTGAHEARSRNLATTWPNGVFWAPPLRLDHVLVSPDIAVHDVREGVGEGSDHQPVVAELSMRARPREAQKHAASGHQGLVVTLPPGGTTTSQLRLMPAYTPSGFFTP